MIIMHSPECQAMMFEFYALVNLARISLDRLLHVLAPVFKTPFQQLPNSVTGFMDAQTDCPVYRILARQPIVPYLIDLRDCVVHYRSFATTDNTQVLLEGEHDFDLVDRIMPGLFKAVFRPVGKRRVSVNVLLPDKIFVRDRSGKKLVAFTYQQRINLLSQSREFLKTVVGATAEAFGLLIEPGKPTYTYTKR